MFEDLNPLDRSTAVLEIIIMLIVAFIIGYLIRLMSDRGKAKLNVGGDTGNWKDKLDNANTKISGLNSDMVSLQKINDNLKLELQESKESKASGELSEKNIGEFKQKILELEEEKKTIINELDEQEKQNYELRQKLKRPAPKFGSIAEAAKTLGFKLAKEDDKEDLTVIKGVGPFIEEKLNELGIYTIEQISDFTIDTVINVTDAIEYFPGRIQRDFWVEQANQILNERAAKS